MSTTRLLILGAVRIFAPVHGYFVRRELVSWHVDRWAHLNPGSVYNALRTLSKDGLLVEGATVPASMGAARTTTYALTHAGEAEFVRLMRGALGTVDEYSPDALMAGVALMVALPREEVAALLTERLTGISVIEAGQAEALEQICADVETPDHVQEVKRLVYARLSSEIRWTAELIARIHAGAYCFAGEVAADYFPVDPRLARH